MSIQEKGKRPDVGIKDPKGQPDEPSGLHQRPRDPPVRAPGDPKERYDDDYDESRERDRDNEDRPSSDKKFT